MKAQIVSLILLLLLCANTFIAGEAVLRPPAEKDDNSSSSNEQDLFAEISAALEANDSATVTNLIAFAIFSDRNVAPAFLPTDFKLNLTNCQQAVLKKSEKLLNDAQVLDTRFSALKNRIMLPGFFEEADYDYLSELELLASRIAGHDHIAEDFRIEGFRITFALKSQFYTTISEDWLKGDNNSLLRAAIFCAAHSKLPTVYARSFERKYNDSKLPLELRIEYAFACSKLTGSGHGLIKSALLNEKNPSPIRFRSIDLLHLLDMGIAAPIFLQIIAKETVDVNVATKLIEILAKWNYEQLAPFLSRYIASETPQLIRATIIAVRNLKVMRLLPEVAEQLKNSDNTSVVIASISCLSDCNSIEYVVPIAEKLYHEDFSIRLEAALAIQNLMKHDVGLKRLMDSTVQGKLIQQIRMWYQQQVSGEK